MKSSLAVRSSGARLTEYMTVFMGGGTPVVVLIEGPEATFNRVAMAQFLDGLQAGKAPFEGRAEPPPGIPNPHGSMPKPPPGVPNPHGTMPAPSPPPGGGPRPPLPSGHPRLPGR